MPVPDFGDIDTLYVGNHLTLKQIGEMKGCSRTTIGRHLRKLGVQIRHAPLDWSDLKELYIDKRLSTAEIAELKGTQRRLVTKNLRKRGIVARSRSEGQLISWSEGKRKIRNIKRGPEHPNWKGGRYKGAGGYIFVYCPSHPFASHNYVYEHRLVMEKRLGRYLYPWELVHHINDVKDDNRDENLQRLTSQLEHLPSIILKRTQRAIVEVATLKVENLRFRVENRQLRQALQEKLGLLSA